MPRVVAEEPWFFTFPEADDGSDRLSVVCGAVARYEVSFALSADERRRYVEAGHDIRERASRVFARPHDYPRGGAG